MLQLTAVNSVCVLQERTRLGENGVKGVHADLSLNARPLPTAGRRLLPCLAWHDSTHIASAGYYRDLFHREMGTLGFVVSALGPRQAEDAIALGLPAFLERWRTYVLDDGSGEAMVGHLDGSSARRLSVLEAQFGEGVGRPRRWLDSAG